MCRQHRHNLSPGTNCAGATKYAVTNPPSFIIMTRGIAGSQVTLCGEWIAMSVHTPLCRHESKFLNTAYPHTRYFIYLMMPYQQTPLYRSLLSPTSHYYIPLHMDNVNHLDILATPTQFKFSQSSFFTANIHTFFQPIPNPL